MLTSITSLKEIVSAVPNTPRQFQIEKDEIMGIDPDKAIAARTFAGVLLKSDDDSKTNGELCKFIEVFYEGGVNITTLFTEELKKQLFKDILTRTNKTDKERDLDTFNPFNQRKEDINSWN